jgi:hypothetical protein
MNSQTIRFLCLTVITLPVVAMGASTASRAQPTSFDGAYKGTLECKRGDVEVFRSLLTINIRGGRITGGARALGIDGKEEEPPIMGAGTVDPEAHFGSVISSTSATTAFAPTTTERSTIQVAHSPSPKSSLAKSLGMAGRTPAKVPSSRLSCRGGSVVASISVRVGGVAPVVVVGPPAKEKSTSRVPQPDT